MESFWENLAPVHPPHTEWAPDIRWAGSSADLSPPFSHSHMVYSLLILWIPEVLLNAAIHYGWNSDQGWR